MNAEIICVGTELLLGDILNTNAKFLSEKLAEMGFNLFSQSVVGDNAERLERQISVSLSRSNIVILSGGLGPTEDDITKETVAKVLNLTLEEDAESLKRIESYFALVGRKMSENNRKQALKIKGSTIIPNEHGTAPGIFLEVPNGAIILLPGPPSELIPMFNNKVAPMLNKYSSSTIFSRNVRLFGVGESAAAEICGDLLKGTNPTVATYAKTGEVDIRVTASSENLAVAKELCNPVVKKLEDLFGNHVYGVDVDNLQQKVVDLLKKKNMKIATAESCTAGMLSERITEVAGASEVFEMGVTAYANYVKIQALGVDAKTIDKKGAVSEDVAAQMAQGIRVMCGADVGVGITGVAGPGQSEGKPAGLVYIAIAADEKVYVRKIMSRGTDRDTTRILATSTALDMVRRYLEGCEDLLSFGTALGEPIKLMEGYETPDKSKLLSKNTKKEAEKKVVQIYSDEELMDMFNTVDETIITDEEIPEKLEIEEDAMNFIFDDDEDTNPETNSYYRVGKITDLFEDKNDAESKNPDTTEKKPENTKEKKDKPTKKRGFFASFFPCKGDPVSEIIRKIIFIVAFLVLVGTTVYLVNYFIEGWDAQNQITEAAKVWEDEKSYEKNKDGIFIGFEALKKQNPDIKAWIEIEGTNINNPVYQRRNDNEYYVEHDMTGASSRYGALFIDKNAIIKKAKTSQNVVIYGHHMKDGTMFGPLKQYTDISFYKKHPIINFRTLYREGEYKIFAVFKTNTRKEHDNGEVFNYCRDSFDSEEDFLQFVDELKKRSIINTSVDVLGDDEIITLSTCTYEFDDARLVVVARRVREGENNEVDTTTAVLNPNPLYPQIWYDKNGGKKPVFSSEPETSSDIVSSDLVSSDETTSSDVLENESDVSVTTSREQNVTSEDASGEEKSSSSQVTISSDKATNNSKKPANSSKKPENSSDKKPTGNSSETVSASSEEANPSSDTENSSSESENALS